MATITFRAETRIPRQIILPLLVANTAQVPRVLTLNSRKMEVHESIADHLEQRYPKWVEPKPPETEPTDEKPLEKMTIAELTELAERDGINLGKAKLHADIVKVIADHQASDEDDESASDADESDEQEADEEEAPDPNA